MSASNVADPAEIRVRIRMLLIEADAAGPGWRAERFESDLRDALAEGPLGDRADTGPASLASDTARQIWTDVRRRLDAATRERSSAPVKGAEARNGR
jgi:hypothetical protein